MEHSSTIFYYELLPSTTNIKFQHCLYYIQLVIINIAVITNNAMYLDTLMYQWEIYLKLESNRDGSLKKDIQVDDYQYNNSWLKH